MKDILVKIRSRLASDKKLLLIAGAGVLGMLLLLLSELVPGSGERVSGEQSAPETLVTLPNESLETLEQRLTRLVCSIDGAGRAVVMVSFEDEGETVYARNSAESAESDGENVKSSGQSEYVLAGDAKQGMPLKSLYPSVRGVAVVCEGGDSSAVKQAVLDSVSAVLGISRADVSVVKMGSDK